MAGRPSSILRQPPVAVVLLAALTALLAWILRYQIIEPEAIGALCQSAAAPLWCPARTGLVVVTKIDGFGWASLAGGIAGFALRGRAALIAVLATAVLGGAGLWLYNTTLAAVGLLAALLRAARLDGRR